MSLHVESIGDGPPLLLLHGWGMHGGIFASLLPSLATRQRVHVVDLPGHGHSAAQVLLTLDSIVDALVDALGDVGDRPASLSILGWSFGGMLAQRIAARFPQRIARLVLVCTTPRFAAAADWPLGVSTHVLRQFGDELKVAYDQTVRRFLSLQMLNAAEAKTTLARLRTQLDARPRADAGALDAALAILETADLRDAAAALAMPALVVTGDRDALTPAAAGVWLAAAMPRAQLAPIAGAAHVPFLSHQAEFDAVLTRFLDAHPA